MAPHEIVILVLGLGAVLAGLAWLIWSAVSIRFPPGQRIELDTEAGTVVHVVLSDDISKVDVNRLASRTAIAVGASAQAWMQIRSEGGVDEDASEIDEVVIWFAPNTHMEALAKMWGFKRLDGFIGKAKTRAFGFRYLPLATISPLVADEVMMTGEPVIHEMMHALLRDYRGGVDGHTNPNVWTASGGAASVQSLARKLFLA